MYSMTWWTYPCGIWCLLSPVSHSHFRLRCELWGLLTVLFSSPIWTDRKDMYIYLWKQGYDTPMPSRVTLSYVPFLFLLHSHDCSRNKTHKFLHMHWTKSCVTVLSQKGIPCGSSDRPAVIPVSWTEWNVKSGK